MTTIYAPAAASCGACGFTTRDLALLGNHSCDVQDFGGRCEDFPCCGHEAGDCNGLLYGSDEAIKAEVYAHAYCEHEAGIYQCDEWGDEWGCDEDCEHDDTSFNEVERDGVMVMVNRVCDRCGEGLPDAPVPAEWL